MLHSFSVVKYTSVSGLIPLIPYWKPTRPKKEVYRMKRWKQFPNSSQPTWKRFCFCMCKLQKKPWKT